MSSRDFRISLAHGQEAENLIARWIVTTYGAIVIPVYDKPLDTGKGPVVHAAHRSWIAPDLLCISAGKPMEWGGAALRPNQIVWVESKRKTHFTWFYTKGTWQTGIDRRHFEDYRDLAAYTQHSVWLLFLHENAHPVKNHDTMPPTCSVGLFGHTLDHLVSRIDHFGSHDEGGKKIPMVYWKERDLLQLATLQEVYACADMTTHAVAS